jgi:hypothetical protein
MTAKEQQYKENRDKLKQLSKAAQKLMETGQFTTINEAILNGIYKTDNPQIQEFKTFNQWKNEGKKIKKGAKGFVIWGKPKKAQAEKPDTKSEEENYKYWPMCYLFSNLQIE